MVRNVDYVVDTNPVAVHDIDNSILVNRYRQIEAATQWSVLRVQGHFLLYQLYRCIFGVFYLLDASGYVYFDDWSNV